MFMFIKSTSLYIILKKSKEGKGNLTKDSPKLFFKRFLFLPGVKNRPLSTILSFIIMKTTRIVTSFDCQNQNFNSFVPEWVLW